MKKLLGVLFVLIAVAFSAYAQTYSYQTQRKFIPPDLGEIYLGMPFDKFAKQFDLSAAQVGDARFDWLQLTFPVNKGNITTLRVRIHGLTQEDKSQILKLESEPKKDEFGMEYNHKFQRLLVDKIPAKGFVYSMYIDFKPEFDLKSFVLKTYGKNGSRRMPDDPYHFYDIEWGKTTSDGLEITVRSFHERERRDLQLLGRIEGTEWGN
ncbi:MAG: hypothetical protein KIS76_14060 [Pyrinomonadaceae bacterium]|nr:hypothetical protein [Pyrinomonadaceae bacterium]